MKPDTLLTWALLGGVGWLAWQWYRGPGIPSHQEGALAAFAGSSLAWPVAKYYEWTLGEGFEPYSAAEAADVQRVADNLNRDVGYAPGGFL